MSERACGVRLHPAARLLRWMGRHAVGVCFLLIGVWLFRAVLAGADGISYDWQWYRVWRYLGRWTDGHFIPGPLLDGLGMTVRIALFGLALAVAAGLGAALLRLSPWPVARGMAHGRRFSQPAKTRLSSAFQTPDTKLSHKHIWDVSRHSSEVLRGH